MICFDQWMTIKERKEMYEIRQKVRELKDENRKKGLKINIEMGNNRVKIRGEQYRWKKEKWKIIE